MTRTAHRISRCALIVVVAGAVAVPSVAGQQAPLTSGYPPQRPVVVRVSEGGFDWRDAGLGALAALAAGLLARGLQLTVRPVRRPQANNNKRSAER